MYVFDTVIDRRNTNSLKWDVPDGELPMWVADMDFKTAPEIIEALRERTNHGVFGYSVIPEEWYTAYILWWQKRHHYTMKKDRLMFCTGVVPAISSIVRKLTTPAERVVIQTPVYNIFFNSILNNGCVPIETELKRGSSGRYHIDFAELEAALSQPQTTLMIFCNPQNPEGRIWTKEEIAEVGRLCRKHHVTVISDEIHCDLTDPGCEYTPFMSVSDDCREVGITCIAPTKAFNLAGLQTAAIYTENEALYNRVNRAINTDEVAEPNAYAVNAVVAAFSRGGEWLDELRSYIFENKKTVEKYLTDNIPCVKLTQSEATYLLWLDCSALGVDSENLGEYIRKETGLYMTAGTEYGKGGEGFMRLNIACPRSVLLDGLERLERAVERLRG